MARKKTTEETEQPQETVVKLISAPKLKSILSSTQKAKEDIAEITGPLGEEIKSAIEKHHLHRKAFNAIKSIYNAPPEKLREFKDHFDYYWEASGLEKKANSAPRLPMGAEEDESNVTQLHG
jgi:hypothetical protein